MNDRFEGLPVLGAADIVVNEMGCERVCERNPCSAHGRRINICAACSNIFTMQMNAVKAGKRSEHHPQRVFETHAWAVIKGDLLAYVRDKADAPYLLFRGPLGARSNFEGGSFQQRAQPGDYQLGVPRWVDAFLELGKRMRLKEARVGGPPLDWPSVIRRAKADLEFRAAALSVGALGDPRGAFTWFIGNGIEYGAPPPRKAPKPAQGST